VSEKMGDFWKSFALGYAGSGVVPPAPVGVADLVLSVKGSPEEVSSLKAGPLNLWIPRAQLQDKEGETHIIGTLRGLKIANRRKPGVLQTIEMISFVSPTGRKKDSEIRLLALAGLHFMISQGVATSSEVHDTAADLISILKLSDHPSGWSAKTSKTLPGHEQVDQQHTSLDNIESVGRSIGEQVGRHLHDFIPAKVTLRPTRTSYAKPIKEVAELVSGLRIPSATSGTFAWKMMTPEKASKLVWQSSLTDISQRYGVSDTAVKKYCAQNDVSMPPSGFWRMNEEKRSGLRRLFKSTDQGTLTKALRKASLAAAAEDVAESPDILKAYCKMQGITVPGARNRK
jgi:hypothetical protein